MIDVPALKKRLLTRRSALHSIAQPWWARCRDVRDYLIPYAGRFEASEVNDGVDRTTKIIDSTATRNARILSAAMMAYANSQARAWFELTLRDKDLAKSRNVKVWLAEAGERIRAVLYASNAYNAMHRSYDELGAFGTSVTFVLPDFQNVVHLYSVTTGQFVLADDEKGNIDTCYREIQMTVAQMVERFGLANCSQSVQNHWKNKQNLDARFTVIHVVEPRPKGERNPFKRDNANKKWRSTYIELASPDDRVLEDSGFDRFPVLPPRWQVFGGDVYGFSPGMECLGHIKQLQQQQMRKAQAIDYLTKPPLQGPTSVKDQEPNTFPGGFTPIDRAAPQNKIEPMWVPQIDLNALLVDIQDVRQQTRNSFYTDLFAMFTGISDTTQRTKTEIDARTEEKMLILGPITAGLYREKHGPLIQIVFEELLRGGGLPPIPEEMSGADVEIEYVSVLAQAMKAVGVNSMDRWMFTVGSIAQTKGPEVWDQVNTDLYIERYADRLGVDPDLIVPGQQVALIRKSRNELNAKKEQAAMLEQNANTANTLAATPVGGAQPSALDAVIGYR
jgi:hypothetical protein